MITDTTTLLSATTSALTTVVPDLDVYVAAAVVIGLATIFGRRIIKMGR